MVKNYLLTIPKTKDEYLELRYIVEEYIPQLVKNINPSNENFVFTDLFDIKYDINIDNITKKYYDNIKKSEIDKVNVITELLDCIYNNYTFNDLKNYNKMVELSTIILGKIPYLKNF